MAIFPTQKIWSNKFQVWTAVELAWFICVAFFTPREMRHRHRLVSSFKCQFFLGRSRPPLGLRTFFPSTEGKLGEKKAPSKTLQSACSLRKKKQSNILWICKNWMFFSWIWIASFFFFFEGLSFFCAILFQQLFVAFVRKKSFEAGDSSWGCTRSQLTKKNNTVFLSQGALRWRKSASIKRQEVFFGSFHWIFHELLRPFEAFWGYPSWAPITWVFHS